MNIIKCPKGHFYDADNFGRCPHCAKREEIEEDKKRSWFSFADRKKQKQNDEDAGPSTAGLWSASDDTTGSGSDSDGDFVPEVKAEGYYSEESSEIIEEVVGWLVCIRGIYKGKSFELHCGANSVGRGPENNIILPKESLLSLKKHFIISYEDRERNFYVLPGESGEFIYLKEKPVLAMTVINDRSVIECGSCAFMLVAFCDEELTWGNL